MRRLGLLFGRELRAYVMSPVTWVVLTLTWLLYGLIWWQSVLPASGGDILHMTWNGAFQAVYLQVFLVPLLTMRLLSEEKRSGTFEMLVTAPVRDHEIVLAKFLAAFLVNAVMWSVIWVYAVIMKLAGGDPDFGPVLSSYLSVIGPGALFIALGLFASSITSHQIMSGFIAVVLVMGFLFLPLTAELFPASLDVLKRIFAAGNLLKQTEEGARGLLDLVHVAYQLAFTALFLFFTVRSLEVRKWA